MDIPTLKTERLTLRPMTFDDWPAYQALWATDRSAYMGGPLDRDAAWGAFCQDHAQWSLFGHGSLMIETDDQTCVGQVGINHGPLFAEKELGWMLYDGHEGHGYALEAARELHRWAFQDRAYDTLVSYVDPDNHRSASVARKLGGVLDPTAPRQDPEDLVFRHSAP